MALSIAESTRRRGHHPLRGSNGRTDIGEVEKGVVVALSIAESTRIGAASLAWVRSIGTGQRYRRNREGQVVALLDRQEHARRRGYPSLCGCAASAGGTGIGE